MWAVFERRAGVTMSGLRRGTVVTVTVGVIYFQSADLGNSIVLVLLQLLVTVCLSGLSSSALFLLPGASASALIFVSVWSESQLLIASLVFSFLFCHWLHPRPHAP